MRTEKRSNGGAESTEGLAGERPRGAPSAPLRVLHAPEVIGGHPSSLARAERELGLASHSVALAPHRFGYEVDEVLWDASDGRLAREAKRWSLLLRALRSFDLVHFNFGSTILPSASPDLLTPPPGARRWKAPLRAAHRAYCRAVDSKDLTLLKRAGKALAVTFQGDDARQGDVCLAQHAITQAREVPGYYTAATDAYKRRRIGAFRKHADLIYALNPDLIPLLGPRARFVPYAHVDPRVWRPVRTPLDRTPVVVHAPSLRSVKGTRFILEASKALRKEGVEHELVLVEGLPQEEARRLYAGADLVVDQLLAGWYGGLAVECMALGKPVMCYIRDEDLAHIPPEMAGELPLLRASPVDIRDALRTWLIDRRHELPLVGTRSRAFVERWHDPQRIAADIRRDYEAVVDQGGR